MIFAFSEPVRVLCEYGVVGLLIFGALIFVLIFNAKSRPLLAGLVAWLTFGLFSYPADIGPLRLLFMIIAAMLANGTRTLKEIKIGPSAKIATTLGLVVLAVAAAMNYIHPRTDLDPDCLYVDGGKLLHEKKYDEAITVFERAAKIAPSSLLFVDLGNCCYAVGRKSEAEKCLRTAIDMTPALATPAYELFDFYRREGRTEDARKWAEYLVTRKFKATNSVTLFARKQAKEYLEEQSR